MVEVVEPPSLFLGLFSRTLNPAVVTFLPKGSTARQTLFI